MTHDEPGYFLEPIVARCGFCGNAEPLPPQMDERARFLQERLLQLRDATERAESASMSAVTTKQSVASYLLMLFAMSALALEGTFQNRYLITAFDYAARAPNVSTIGDLFLHILPAGLTTALSLGFGIGYFMMSRTYSRTVREAKLARPPLQPSGHARCRTCGGELVVDGGPSVECPYCHSANLLGEALTKRRAQLLENETRQYRERLENFGKTLENPFKAPTYVFYIWSFIGFLAISLLITGLVVGLVLLRA